MTVRTCTNRSSRKPYIGFPFISNIHPNVINTLNKRRSRGFRNSDSTKTSRENYYNPPKAVWARMHSNSRNAARGVGPTGPKLDTSRPFKYLLMGSGILTKSGFNARTFGGTYAYRRNDSDTQLLRPTPGIESISIVTNGEFGQTLRTTINWACNSVDDLEELIPYFLTPGITVFIEWGWGEIDNDINAFDLSDTNRNLNAELLRVWKNPDILFKKSIDSNGKYGALMGIITNFNFQATDDGGFSCTTELSSMGELIAGLNLQESVNYTTNETNPLVIQRKRTIKEYINKKFDKTLDDAFHRPYINSGDIVFSGDTFDVDGEAWVTWGFLEDVIINEHLKIESQSGYRPLELDSTCVHISNHEKLYSTDPEIMLIARNGKGSVKNFDVPFSDSTASNRSKSGIMRNIYVNTKVIIEEFNNSETLEEALNKILNRINSAGSQVWRFKLQVSPETEKLRVVDMNYTSDSVNLNSTFNFGGFDGRGIITSYNLESKMSDALKAHIMFARNKDLQTEKNTIIGDKQDSGIETLWGVGFEDIVLSQLENKSPFSDDSGEDSTDSGKRSVDAKYTKKIKESVGEPIEEVREFRLPKNSGFMVIDSQTAKKVAEEIREKKNSNIRRHQVLLPIELEVELDGITGILPGNIFTIENIPSSYVDNGVFQVMNLEHNITADNWDTKVRSMYRIVDVDEEFITRR